MRATHFATVQALLTACQAQSSLDAVPIVGATPEQLEAVEKELEAFERWSGAGRVELREIAFTQLRGNGGKYNRVTRRVLIDSDMGPRDARYVLRHELCHALDRQENLLARPTEVFDSLVAAIEANDDHPLRDNLGRGFARGARAEVMAYVCGLAPLGTRMLAAPCDGDPVEYAEVARWVNDVVWAGEPDVSAGTLVAAGEPVRWTAGAPVQLLQMLGSEGSPLVSVVYDQADVGPDVAFTDTRTGAPVPEIEDLGIWVPTEPLPADLPFGFPSYPDYVPMLVERVWSVAQGDEAVVALDGLGTRHLEDRLAPRALAYAEGRWTLVDACPGDEPNVFVAGGTFHLGWEADGDIAWAPLGGER